MIRAGHRVVAALVGALATTACATQPPAPSCHFEGWNGTCNLGGVRTTRIVERFPRAYVFVAGLYQPRAEPGGMAPAAFEREFIAPAENEHELTEHLKRQTQVPCSFAEATGDPCSPKMEARVAEFAPPARATGPVGCARIEQAAGSEPAPVKLPGPFQFAEASASESDEVRRLAADAARLILGDPRIECVAIRGQTAPGEDFVLANDRAQAVRHLLEAQGIDRTRLTVFEASAPTHTATPDEQPNPEERRRVHLTVVVYGKPPASP